MAKSLNSHLTKSFEDFDNSDSQKRTYHLSYDTKNGKHDFQGDSDKARRYVVCVLSKAIFVDIYTYCESTIIVEYDSLRENLDKHLRNNLKEEFFYTLTLVAQLEEGKRQITQEPNMSLNVRFAKQLMDDFDFKEFDVEIKDYESD